MDGDGFDKLFESLARDLIAVGCGLFAVGIGAGAAVAGLLWFLLK